MAYKPISKNGFRFVNVRAPNRPEEDERTERPLHGTRGSELRPWTVIDDTRQDRGSFAQELRNFVAEQRYDDALNLARQYAEESGLFVGGFGQLDQPLNRLRILMDRWIARLDTDGFKIDNELREAVSSISGALEGQEHRIWDSLYTIAVIGKIGVGDAGELAALLRLIAIVRYLATENPTLDGIREILRADAIVPSDILPAPDAKATLDVEAFERDVIEHQAKQRSVEKECVEKLLHRQSALREIRQMPWIDHDAKEREHKVRAKRILTWSRFLPRRSATVIEPEGLEPTQSDSTLTSTDRIQLQDLDSVSDRTRSIIAELGEGMLLSLDQIVSGIESGMADIAKALSAEVGTGRTLSIASVIGSSAYTKETGDLQAVLNLVDERRGTIDPCDYGVLYMPVGCVRPVGVGDLNILRETLLGYRAGEIAHIQNVLQSEVISRTHRQLDRTEDTSLIEEEQTEENVRDLQSTERFELSSESEKVIQTEFNLDAGVTVSGSYGFVDFSAYADASLATSTSTTTRRQSQFAREVVEKATDRIQKRVREEHTRRNIFEVEETNLHAFDNKEGNDHISGIYRWVEKQYNMQVVNYGRRMMFDFVVPEPAAFFRHSQNNRLGDIGLRPPVDPTLWSHKTIYPWSYEEALRRWKVVEADPPPPEFKHIFHAFAAPQSGQSEITQPYDWQAFSWAENNIEVPEGYSLGNGSVVITAGAIIDGGDPSEVIVTVGNKRWRYFYAGGSLITNNMGTVKWIGGAPKNLAIAVRSWNLRSFSGVAVVGMTRSATLLEQWQLHIWERILSSYRQMKAEYEEALSEAEEQRRGVLPTLTNADKRRVEREEITKACLTQLTFQHFNWTGSTYIVPPYNYPETHPLLSYVQGKIIRFFEDAFEWENMTYVFYPYFWGKKANWIELSGEKDIDPMFQKFLQAGAARAVVPVRPEYERAILYYQKRGAIWEGGDPPTIGDPLYVPILEDLKNQYGIDDAKPTGEEWDVTLPTSLVTLKSDELPYWGSATASATGTESPSRSSIVGAIVEELRDRWSST